MNSNPVTLKYRPSVHKFYRWALGLTLLAELVIIRINIIRIMDESWYMGAFTLLLASTVPISIFIRLFFYIRPWIQAEYELGSDRLVIRTGKKQRDLNFVSVARVNYSWFSPRFFGGFNLELTSGQKFRFFSVLENSHLILERLNEVRSGVLVEKDFKSYERTSQRVMESWARMLRKLKNWKTLIVKYLMLPWVAAWSLPDHEDAQYVLIAMTLSFWFVGVLLNHFEEAHLLSKPKEDLQDGKYEARIEKAVNAIYFLISVGVFMAGRAFLSR